MPQAALAAAALAAAVLAVPQWVVVLVLVGGACGWTGYLLAWLRSRRAEHDLDAVRATMLHVRLPVVSLESLASGIIDQASPEFEQMVGARPGQLVGCRYVDLVHPDDLAETVRVVTEIIEQPGTLLADFPNRWRRLDTGQTVHIDWHQLTADGRLWKGRDISADVAAREAARQAQLRAADAEADLEVIRPLVDLSLRKPGR